MKNVVILCASLVSLTLVATVAMAIAGVANVNDNEGGRAGNASENLTVPTAAVCNCGTGGTMVQYSRGSRYPAGTMLTNGTIADGATGKADAVH